MIKQYNIASVSWGKDSLAMLFLLLEHPNYPLSEVVFYDTGMEFQAIYDTRDAMLPILIKHNVKYTELHPSMPFRDKMYNYPHKSRKGTPKRGYGWCGGLCRWGTTEKIKAIDKYCKDKKATFVYVGLAKDEYERLEKLRWSSWKISPLDVFGYTEEMCLKLCYSKGFYWEEMGVKLYDILDRVSCWCCRNKNLKELANYKKYLPDYYKKLQELDSLS